MLAQDIMTRQVITVRADTTVDEIAHLLDSHHDDRVGAGLEAAHPRRHSSARRWRAGTCSTAQNCR